MPLDVLGQLATQVPGLNPTAATRTQAAGQSQAFVAAAKLGQQGKGTTAAVQTLAEQDVTQRAQQELQAQQQRQVQQQQVAEMALAEQQAQQQATLENQRMAAAKVIEDRQNAEAARLSKFGIEQDNSVAMLSKANKAALAGLSQDVDDKLFGELRKFNKSEAGRKISNERQLATWTITNAKSQEELQTKLQNMQQLADRDIKIMEIAQQQLLQQMQQDYIRAEGAEKSRLAYELAATKKATDEALAKKKAKAANDKAMMGAAFTVGGAILGGIAGSIIPGGGTVAGAGVGGTIGTAVGNAVSQ